MPLKTDHSKDIRKAVKIYWQTKSSALAKNKIGAKADQGKRGGATAGKNLDGFTAMLIRLIKKIAPKELEIYENKGDVALPGHFRPSKQWDLVLMFKGRLIAALELKSLGGPSFGNNANNRCEEALGSGVDFSVAQREGLFGAGASPFIGYFILVEDAEGSRKELIRRSTSKHFDADPAFSAASYQHRMRILCERMAQERIYTASAVMATPSSSLKTGAYTDLSKETSLNRLIVKLLAHVQIETSD